MEPSNYVNIILLIVLLLSCSGVGGFQTWVNNDQMCVYTIAYFTQYSMHTIACILQYSIYTIALYTKTCMYTISLYTIGCILQHVYYSIIYYSIYTIALYTIQHYTIYHYILQHYIIYSIILVQHYILQHIQHSIIKNKSMYYICLVGLTRPCLHHVMSGEQGFTLWGSPAPLLGGKTHYATFRAFMTSFEA